MVGIAAILVVAPLVLAAALLGGVTAVFVGLGSPAARFPLVLGRLVLLLMWGVAASLALLSGLVRPDWVHDFWGAQIPMVGLFLGSGVLLCGVWSDDAALLARSGGATPIELPPRRGRLASPAWTFLGLLAVSSLVPLLLQVLFPGSHESGRGTGHPVRNLVELAHWGLGGPLPPYLEPFGVAGALRGIDYLPREVTVPMGTTLIAAWLWIGFSVLALAGRLIRTRSRRIAFLLVAPPLAGLLGLVLPGFPLGAGGLAFDDRFFGPVSSESSGLWTSDPVTLESYGRVLLAAAACAALLAAGLWVTGASYSRNLIAANPATPSTSSRSVASSK